MTDQLAPPRVHIVGRKNSGKTTLVCQLVRELTARRILVATVKHTHHDHELDTPGKDSHLHRTAGAAGVGILSPEMTAVFIPVNRELDTTNRESRYQRFESMFGSCDLILVEGDLQTTAPRIEVWRSAVTELPYAAADSAIAAVVSDDSLPCAGQRIPRSDISAVVAAVLKLAELV